MKYTITMKDGERIECDDYRRTYEFISLYRTKKWREHLPYPIMFWKKVDVPMQEDRFFRAVPVSDVKNIEGVE